MNDLKIIEKEITVNEPVMKVWDIWTTEKGAMTFFAPKANLNFKIGGKYEMLFDLNQTQGKQGSEGTKILSYLPLKMLSFDWNAPTEFGTLRNEKTVVVLMFDKLDDQKTKITLSHFGWGDGDNWDKLYKYFDRAWNIVLGRLKYSLEVSPIDWNNPYNPL